MRKFSIFLIITLGLVFCLRSLGLAQELREELVYSLKAYDGKGHEGTFTPQAEATIYLIANKSSTISARITLVYLWPETGRYVTAFKALDEEMQGTLEILKNGRVVRSLGKRDNTLYYPQGYWGESSVLCLEKDAHASYEKFNKARDEYYEKVSEYYAARAEYEKKMDELSEQVKEKRGVGERGPLDIKMPEEPEPPEGLGFYVTEPDKDYVVNLPTGNYQIRIRADDGTIVQDSEKNLVVFTSRTPRGIGYGIIRDNRWMLRESCSQADKAIYGKEAKILYLRPYYQNEYNELYYNKLKDPQNSGNIAQWRWFNIASMKNVVLFLLKEGNEIERIERKSFYVKQILGGELKYNINEFEQNKLPEGARPTFEGYKLNLSLKDPGTYEIILLDKNSGKLIDQSRKELIVEKLFQKLEAEKQQKMLKAERKAQEGARKEKAVSNVALGKPCITITNRAEDYSDGHAGEWPRDITDGNLAYEPVSSGREDGCIAWENRDREQLLVVTVTIDLEGAYNITKIRYNPGNCQRAETWNGDIMESPFGRTPTNPGSSYRGAWTEQTGSIAASKVTIKLEKTRRSDATNWLFIGEIEVWGTPLVVEETVRETETNVVSASNSQGINSPLPPESTYL